MANYVGAIDQGTTSTRFIIFDHAGKIVSIAQKEHGQIFPQPGWVEHDPEEIWLRTRQVVAEAMAQASLRSGGAGGDRHHQPAGDHRSMEPPHRAADSQRPGLAGYARGRLRHGIGARGRRGPFPAPDRAAALALISAASRFAGCWTTWRTPASRPRRRDVLFGNIDTFLLWHLTGGVTGGLHITDATNASRTQLMNLETLDWDAEMLHAFGVPRHMLPQIRSSSERYGEAALDAVKGVPLAGILGDQQAALVGQTCFRAGEAKNTYGTGCFLLMNTGGTIVHSRYGLLTTVAFRVGKQPANYALEGSVAITGALVQWLRDNFGLIARSPEIEALARTVEDNGGVYFVPAFSGLYAPYWKHNARGVIAGLTRYSNKGHLARAALEATAFQTREVVEAMEKDAGVPLSVLRADGGMVENDLLMQFQADILDREVVRPAVKETTALGAAYAAGLAVGFYDSLEDLRSRWSVDRTWKPKMEAARREKMYGFWKKAVTRSFDWLDEE